MIKNLKLKLGLMMILMLLIVGCSQSAPNEQHSDRSETSKADGLVDVINGILEQEEAMGVMELDEEMAKDFIGLDVSLTDEYHLMYGMGRFGIADIFVVKPKAGHTEEVMEAFKEHQQNRMNTFEHYNVDGDYDKAKNALIYKHGNYVILLVLSNPESAQELINNYLAQ